MPHYFCRSGSDPRSCTNVSTLAYASQSQDDLGRLRRRRTRPGSASAPTPEQPPNFHLGRMAYGGEPMLGEGKGSGLAINLAARQAGNFRVL
jgi:hypothetical protein